MTDAPMPDYRPLLSLVELTLRCNMRCLHCGSTSGRPRRDELSDAELIGVLDALAELGAEEVVLLGGEPLLHPAWETLCRHGVARGLRPILITNGWLLDERMVRRCEDAGTSRVGVSLDGPSAEIHDAIRGVPGAYERAMRAARALRERGVTCSVITCVSRLNLRQLPAMRDQLVGQGLGWQIQVASPNGARFDPEHMLSRAEFYALARFISRCRGAFSLAELPVAGAHDIGYHSCQLTNYGFRPEWLGCQGGLSTVGIQSDGCIKPCLSMDERFREGNVRTDGLAAVWRDPSRFRRNRRFRAEWLEGGCAPCEHGPSCRAGCPDIAQSATGSVFDNPYCLLRIEREGVDRGPELWDEPTG
jgi:radical SAM protein with 4Fe4S-binding SPASM domain